MGAARPRWVACAARRRPGRTAASAHSARARSCRQRARPEPAARPPQACRPARRCWPAARQTARSAGSLCWWWTTTRRAAVTWRSPAGRQPARARGRGRAAQAAGCHASASASWRRTPSSLQGGGLPATPCRCWPARSPLQPASLCSPAAQSQGSAQPPLAHSGPRRRRRPAAAGLLMRTGSARAQRRCCDTACTWTACPQTTCRA